MKNLKYRIPFWNSFCYNLYGDDMKKYIGILLIIVLLLSGCKNKNNEEKNNNSNNNDNKEMTITEDVYYMYTEGNNKKELLLRSNGTVYYADCNYSCEIFSGTYKQNNNEIEVTLDKSYDEYMCEKGSDKTTNNYVIDNNTLKLNDEVFNKVDKTDADDLNYYKDVKCNNRRNNEGGYAPR